jgi:pilus assembly protein FimV
LKINSFLAGRFALKAVALAAMLFTSSQVSALGLGRLAVQSNLGEALRADIDVSSLTPEEAANLQVKVATPEAYRAAGVDYNAVLPGTKVVLLRRADGKPYLRVTSDRVVQEPFVDVILDISWSSGRLVREYTMLFDPPSTRVAAAPAPDVAPSFSSARPEAERPAAKQPPQRAVAAAPKAPVAQTAPAPTPTPSPARRSVRKAPAPTNTNANANASQGASADEYKVRNGDSLSRIATRVQKPGISLDQMLVALYQANPQAFLNGNINRLKAGVVLAVPTADAAKSVTEAQARQIIQASSSDFGSYRQRLGGAVNTAKAEGSSRQAKGTVQASVEDGKQNSAPTPDKLTLTKGSPKASAPEARLSKEQEQKESNARVAELAKNVDELKKLSSASAASSGKNAASAASSVGANLGIPVPPLGVPAPEPAAPIAASAPANAVPPVPAPTPPVIATEPAPAASTAAPVAAVASEPASTLAPAASKPAVVAAPRVQPTETPEDSSGPIWENPLALAAGGGLLALLAGFGVFRFLKRSKKESGETSFLESRLQPDSFFGASGGQRVDTRDGGANSSSMSYSLSQLDAIGDVDPVAEADVYLAYGRDLQAEEILKEAMRTNPERLAIRTKLLEVYAKRRDTKGFEMLATQLHGLTGGKGEDWEKAQEMGRQIESDNQLYHAGGAPAVSGDDRGSQGSNYLGATTMPQSTLPARGGLTDGPSGFESTVGNTSVDLDFDLRSFAGSAGASSAALGATALGKSPSAAEFKVDTPDFHTQKTTPGALDDGHQAMDFDLSGISLDLDSNPDSVTIPLPVKNTPSSSAGGDTDSLNFALHPTDPSDPMEAKLALAREFGALGELEGARDLLRDVIATATGTMKSRAQSMLDEMG